MIMQLEHISKSFGGRQLFHDVTFRLEEYDRLALVGPNGAGKTTLLNIISGQEDADEVTKAFLEYMLSDAVQGSLVEEQGFIPVSKMTVVKDAEGNVSEK